METVVTRPAARQHRQGLKALDLRSLPREEGPPSELQIRREKFAYFEKRCSEVSDGLYLGSEAVAKSRELLERSNITHVVNCVGFVYPNYFEGELTYKTLFLQDTPAEDITSVLYDVFDFIEEARGGGGSVFVHCSQGVSRSATIVIAFLMWKLDQSFDEVFAAVKVVPGSRGSLGVCAARRPEMPRRRMDGPPACRGEGRAAGRVRRMRLLSNPTRRQAMLWALGFGLMAAAGRCGWRGDW
eukprot:CAMPEP_0177581128 /NCGR_PEP_ID=MMETSP0419_2-20121207/1971_1 /TAXON_ID=582737 /ORGANISM="Tetraselmis sp., Strain GSL018" /LENGTH=241 /DNA_ID=CAMNT_0019070127 /DNA_START=725 /DNA_END=1447 /DNA_ORIENTATION=-